MKDISFIFKFLVITWNYLFLFFDFISHFIFSFIYTYIHLISLPDIRFLTSVFLTFLIKKYYFQFILTFSKYKFTYNTIHTVFEYGCEKEYKYRFFCTCLFHPRFVLRNEEVITLYQEIARVFYYDDRERMPLIYSTKRTYF